jgi:hypothetical protein
MSNVLPADGAYHRSLVKFLAVSATALLIGTIHGMLQVLPPIRPGSTRSAARSAVPGT